LFPHQRLALHSLLPQLSLSWGLCDLESLQEIPLQSVCIWTVFKTLSQRIAALNGWLDIRQ
jgi:hypothetical protein